ncbi:MAG TPA: diacylglycerol kinase [Oceanospirillaceae bacterium]|nr:diacylglycerol kinase [Oceanospirillaceae bacterium]
MTMYPKNKGVFRFWKALIFSLKGMRYCFHSEAAMREYTTIFIITLPFVFILGESPVERIILIGVGVLVLIVEHLNSAIEATLDRISTDHHDLTGAAKDMGSAAVFLATLLFAYTWIEFTYRHFSN